MKKDIALQAIGELFVSVDSYDQKILGDIHDTLYQTEFCTNSIKLLFGMLSANFKKKAKNSESYRSATSALVNLGVAIDCIAPEHAHATLNMLFEFTPRTYEFTPCTY